MLCDTGFICIWPFCFVRPQLSSKQPCCAQALPCAGMTAAIIDETLGGLNYVLKREGVVPHGPSFTVHLEVGWRLRRALLWIWERNSYGAPL